MTPCDKSIDYCTSPLGTIEITASNAGITRLVFLADGDRQSQKNPETSSIIERCKTQLNGYFQKDSFEFDVPLDLQGTPFQTSVWQRLQTIAYGKTVSYQTIANQLNQPKAVRAVGAANGQNPISIIVPCHRVIGSNGKLTGYAGGLERKAWLLEHESEQLRLI